MPGPCTLVRDEEGVASFQVTGPLLAVSQHMVSPSQPDFLELPHLSNPRTQGQFSVTWDSESKVCYVWELAWSCSQEPE